MKSCVVSLAMGAVVLGVVAPVSADAFERYGDSYRAFMTPPIGGGSFGVTGDALPDGRLLMVTGNSVFVESAVGSAVFDEVGVFDASETGGATDPEFLTISPDGLRVAVGVGFGKPVAVFDVSALGTAGAPTMLTSGNGADYFGVGHFDGSWYDNTRLALTAGVFGEEAFVSLLDTTSDVGSPINDLVITGIAGASAGVAFDDAGRLYTANGFADGSGSGTGNIRVFEVSEWMGGVDFEVGGVFVGDVLSGGGLRFDTDGNLFVGGGDFGDFDAGYLGVINAWAIADALGGFGAIDPSDPLDLRRLDPRGDGFGYYASAYNMLTGELYVADGEVWYATVPAPGSVVMFGCAGLMAWRRRRG